MPNFFVKEKRKRGFMQCLKQFMIYWNFATLFLILYQLFLKFDVTGLELTLLCSSTMYFSKYMEQFCKPISVFLE